MGISFWSERLYPAGLTILPLLGGDSLITGGLGTRSGVSIWALEGRIGDLEGRMGDLEGRMGRFERWVGGTED